MLGSNNLRTLFTAIFLSLFILPVHANEQASNRPYYLEIVSTLKEVREKPSTADLDRFLSLFKKEEVRGKTLTRKSSYITSKIFKEQHFEPDNSYLSRENLDNVLPDAVIRKKRGHCLGLTTLFVLAAEKLGLDVAVAHAPDHIFPRLCESAKCLNIEMLKTGENMPDEYYVKNLFIPKKATEAGIYLKSIRDPSDLAASIYVGLGFVANGAKQPELAELFYKKAVEKNPNSAEAHSNLAAALMQAGDSDQGVKEMETAYRLNPYSYFVAVNLGVLKHKAGKKEEALALYDRAIETNPLSVHAYRKRSKLYEEMGRNKEAALDLAKILVIQPQYCDVAEDYITLSKKLKLAFEKPADDLRRATSAGKCLQLGL